MNPAKLRPLKTNPTRNFSQPHGFPNNVFHLLGIALLLAVFTTFQPPVIADEIFISSDENVTNSTSGAGTNVLFRDEDIIRYNTNTGDWDKFFDGSTAGLTGNNNIDAFHIDDNGDIYMSFSERTFVPGILPKTNSQDIVLFDSSSQTFSLFFDGSDVKLTRGTEDVDAITFAQNGDLVISTSGFFIVSGLIGGGEDLIVFNDTSFGPTTAGTFELFLDGSTIGLERGADLNGNGILNNADLNIITGCFGSTLSKCRVADLAPPPDGDGVIDILDFSYAQSILANNDSENIWGTSIDPDSGDVFFTLKGAFDVSSTNSLSGTEDDIINCVPQMVGPIDLCMFFEVFMGVDEGFPAGKRINAIQVVRAGAIGDTVFCDNNNNGVQDADDPGIEGVVVNLVCTTPGGMTITDSATTDANGNYLFTGIPANSNCEVTVDPATAPDDKEPGDNCPDTFNVDVAAGESFLDADFCFKFRSGKIGDTVFCDRNNNGVQDADDPGIEGVTVNLVCTAPDGTVINDSQPTDANGNYLFTGIPANSNCEVTVDPATAPDDKEPGDNCPDTFNVDVAAGESFLDADFCFKFRSGKIGDTVFCDRNNNGVQDADDPGIEGVTVNLVCTAPDGTVINDSQPTDANGNYLFTGIPANSNCEVTVDPATAPDDKEPGDNCPDTFNVDVAAGESFLDADFCFKFRSGKIGDTVFCDRNNNGVQDADDPGIEGVTVNLVCTAPDGTVINDSQPTDANGNYLFTGIPANSNCEVTVDPATAPDDKEPGDNCPDTFNVDVAAGESFLDADFCFKFRSGKIGDTVFCDRNNNGVQDADDPGIEGVTVNLVCTAPDGTVINDSQPTDANGNYLFTGIPANSNCEVTVDPATAPDDKEPGDNCPDTFNVDVAAGESFLDADFCFKFRSGKIGDTVFCDRNNNGVQDADDPGIEGVTVNLVCTAPDGTVINDSQPTDANGNYLFTGIPANSNCEVTVDPATAPDDKEPGDNCPDTFNVDVAAGESFLDADFCFKFRSGKIGDTVFCDRNNNGVQDADDPGIEGVTVNLVCTAPDGTVINDSQPTDANGNYLFTGIPANSNCEVTVDPATAPDDKEPGDNCPDTFNVDVAAGESFLDADFCFKFRSGKIGDTVFCDRNNNGVQDADDPGIEGVTVNLVCTAPDGTVINDSQPTDANGNYLFTGIPANSNCEVTVDPATAPDDKEPGDNCPDTFNVDVAAGESFLDADFCFKFRSGKIGDTVFCDRNNNGVQDADDPGIEGVTVNLVCTAPDGTVINDSQPTDANGNYLFTGIPANSNCEVTVDPATAPDDKEPGDNCPDTFNVDVAAGESFLDADFCFKFKLVSLGNVVFDDNCESGPPGIANNGIKEPSEPGIPNVTVELYNSGQNPSVDTAVASTTTAADGSYIFDSIVPGNYFAHIPAAEFTAGDLVGYVSTTGQGTTDADDDDIDENGDDNEADGVSTIDYDLQPDSEPTGEAGFMGTSVSTQDDDNTNLTADFGFYQPVSVGNLVFEDNGAGGGTAGNGIKEAGESGIANVTIELYKAGENPAVDTSTADIDTAVDGSYILDSFPPGNYFVHIPAANFEPGEALENFVSSTGQGTTETDDDDMDENGDDTETDGVSTIVYDLQANSEPTGETGFMGISVSTQDDDNTNLTVDFGFLAVMANLSVTKVDSPDPVDVNNPITYTITVFNAGPDDAQNVVLTDTLPAGTTFVSSTGCLESPAGGVPTCTLGTIVAGGSAIVTITVTAPAMGGLITNNVSVTSDTDDPNGDNNSASEDTTVEEPQANLSVTKVDALDPVQVNDPLTYTITVFNAGPDDAQNVVLTDTLPAGTTFVSSTGCLESPAGGVPACTLGTIVAGGSAIVTIAVTAPATPGLITNNVSVTSDTADPNGANNSASEDTTVEEPQANLSVTKVDSPDPVDVNNPITYTIAVFNAGPDDAQNVVLTDTLPAGTTFVSSTGCLESPAGGVPTCTLGTIVAGGSAIVTITVIAPASDGVITNNVSVTSDTTDPNGANNSASEDTTVQVPQPTAVDDTATVNEDDPATIINVLGNDLNLAGAIVASVTQPAGGVVVNNGTDVSYTPNANFCNNPPGTTDDFTYTLTTGGATGTATVSVTVTCVNDAPTINSSASASVEENQTGAIDVQSTDDSDSEMSGLTYAITGGEDDGLFDIDADTGVLTFNMVPDFEFPFEPGGDNDYEVQVTVTDSGGLTDIQDITVTVTNVNDAPINSTPGAMQMTIENTTLTFSTANGNQLNVTDQDEQGATDFMVTLSTENGTLALVNSTGLTVVGDGSSVSPLIITGVLANINTAFEMGLIYSPDTGFVGTDTLTMFSEDKGNTGTGGNLTDTDSFDIIVNAVPTADANGPYVVNEGSSVALDGSGSSDPNQSTASLTFEWDLDDDGNFDDAVGISPTFNGIDDGIFPITLRVSDDGFLADTDTTTVTVNNVAPTAEAGGPYSVVAGETVTLSASATDPGVNDTFTFEWDFDADGNFGETGAVAPHGDETGQTPTFDPILPAGTAFSVQLRVTDDDGGVGSDSATITVVQSPAPTADAGAGEPYVVNEGSSVALDGSGSSDPNQSTASLLFEWDLDDDGVFDVLGINPPFAGIDDGIFPITLRVSDDGGLADTDTTTVTVNNVAPTAEAGGPYSVVTGDTVALSGSATDPGVNDTFTFAWDFDGDGNFGETGAVATLGDETGQTPTFDAAGLTAGTTFPAQLRVTDDDGGVDTDLATINILQQ